MPGAFTRFAPARAGLVSVVIPTKDRPEAIFDAVKSVFESSYQRFELFVVDQSSGDATKAILQPFMSDPRFTYLENRRPGFGAASSRNVGIALSNGEFVAVIDDDVTVVVVAVSACAVPSDNSKLAHASAVAAITRRSFRPAHDAHNTLTLSARERAASNLPRCFHLKMPPLD